MYVAGIDTGCKVYKVEGISEAKGDAAVVKFGTYLPSGLEHIPCIIAHFLFVQKVYGCHVWVKFGYHVCDIFAIDIVCQQLHVAQYIELEVQTGVGFDGKIAQLELINHIQRNTESHCSEVC